MITIPAGVSCTAPRERSNRSMCSYLDEQAFRFNNRTDMNNGDSTSEDSVRAGLTGLKQF
jgi:hypothetical protein